jgi:hypothetical protein
MSLIGLFSELAASALEISYHISTVSFVIIIVETIHVPTIAADTGLTPISVFTIV